MEPVEAPMVEGEEDPFRQSLEESAEEAIAPLDQVPKSKGNVRPPAMSFSAKLMRQKQSEYRQKLTDSTDTLKIEKSNNTAIHVNGCTISLRKDGLSKEAWLYLRSRLERVLSACLGDVCSHRPEDPIEFMARWLYCYADSRIYLAEKAAFLRAAAQMALQLKKERKARLQRMKDALSKLTELRDCLFQLSPSMAKLETAEIGFDAQAMAAAMAGSRFASMDEGGQDLAALDPMGVKGKMMHLQNLRMTAARVRMSSRTSVSSLQSGRRFTTDSIKRLGRNQDEMSTITGDGEEGEGEEDRKSSVKRKEVYWYYEVPPGRIICIHPTLGKLARPLPVVTDEERLEDIWLVSDELPCASLYQPELYVCLPENMTFFTPEHVEHEECEDTVDEPKQGQSLHSSVYPTASSVGTKPESGLSVAIKPEEEKDEESPYDDDPRWRHDGDESSAFKSWALCEGFKLQASDPSTPSRTPPAPSSSARSPGCRSPQPRSPQPHSPVTRSPKSYSPPRSPRNLTPKTKSSLTGSTIDESPTDGSTSTRKRSPTSGAGE